MKVVINDEFGGFGLSDKAFEKLLERKGIEFEKSEKEKFGITHYYVAGHLGEDEHYLSPYDYYNDRADADLIAVIEEMGKDANGTFSSLKVIEIPDGIEWHVHEYDGLEHIAENHRTWY